MPVSAANAPSSAALGTGRPTCFSASSVAGTVQAWPLRKPRDDLGEMQLIEALVGVDAAYSRSGCSPWNTSTVEQRRVLDDQRVGLQDRLAQPDLLVVDPAERDDRRARALRAEARKRLGMLAFEERGDRQQLGGGHDALAATAVNAHLDVALPARDRERDLKTSRTLNPSCEDRLIQDQKQTAARP